MKFLRTRNGHASNRLFIVVENRAVITVLGERAPLPARFGNVNESGVRRFEHLARLACDFITHLNARVAASCWPHESKLNAHAKHAASRDGDVLSQMNRFFSLNGVGLCP
jgi:hypothetical protein